MPVARVDREETAHTTADLSIGAPTARITRKQTGGVEATLHVEGQGL